MSQSGQPAMSSVDHLARRIAACERALSGSSRGTSSTGGHSSEPSSSSSNIYARVSDLERKLKKIRDRTPELAALESAWPDLQPLVFEDSAGFDHLLLQKAAKREYVLQHAAQLLDYANLLKGLERDENAGFHKTWQELEDRVQTLSRHNEVLVRDVVALSNGVQDLVEGYADVVNRMSNRLLAMSIKGQ